MATFAANSPTTTAHLQTALDVIVRSAEIEKAQQEQKLKDRLA